MPDVSGAGSLILFVRRQHDDVNYNIKNMSESLPPPIPSGPPQRNAGDQPPATASGRESRAIYNILADKIGGVPNVRKKDNLYQAVTVGVFLIVGVIVGWAVGGWPEGVLLGVLGGLIAGILISGVILMIIGLWRKP